MKSLCIVILCLLVVSVSAYGDYVVTPLSGGNSTKAVAAGGSFDLDIVLSGDDVNYAAIFEVDADETGLLYNSYTWGSPYVTSSVDDYTDISSLPLYFENFLNSGTFGLGTLVSVNITVPAAYWDTHTEVVFSIVDDPNDPDDIVFSNDEGDVPTTVGGTFTLTPEPVTMVLMGIGGGIALLRRRRS